MKTAYLISNEELESTETFKKLEPFSKNIMIRLSSKKDISYGLISFRSTGVIPGSLSGNNRKIVEELIQKES